MIDVDRPTCRFEPDSVNYWFDDDGVEHCEEGAADENCEVAYCSNCGREMLCGYDGWFDRECSPHGGIILKPRFEFCPHCGAEVAE